MLDCRCAAATQKYSIVVLGREITAIICCYYEHLYGIACDLDTQCITCKCS